jgi:hypothetical protein
MPKWMPCDGKFVESDVLRWREPVWKPKRGKTAKPVLIGERLITAQLLREDGGWLEFALLSCETKNAETWWKKIPELKPDKPLRRSRAALLKRNPERRPWGAKDGEAARVLAASRFLR